MSAQQSDIAALRVVEIAGGMGATYAGRVLLDLGAAVTKVRRLGGADEDGDATRLLDGGKQIVRVAAEDEAAWAAALDGADVLLCEGTPDMLDLAPLMLAQRRAEQPRLITAALTPFGESGPNAGQHGTDLIAVHAGGLGYGTPPRVVDPEREYPLGMPGDCTSLLGGLVLATGVLHALAERDRDGRGRHVELSLQDLVASLMFNNVAGALDGSGLSSRLASARANARKPMLRTADGWVVAMVNRPEHIRAWLGMMGEAGAALLERIAQGEPVAKLRNAIDAAAEAWAADKTRREVTERAQGLGVPVEPVLSPDELLDCPQLGARGFWREAEAGSGLRLPDAPFGPVAAGDGPRRLPARLPGQGTREDLAADSQRDAATAETRVGGTVQHPVVAGPDTAVATGDAEGTRQEPGAAGGGAGAEQAAREERVTRDSAWAWAANLYGAGEARGPLAGLRVVDFSWVFAAPIATRILAALGADVLRVESLRNPDPMRERPFSFRVVNGDKRSAVLDAREPEGFRTIEALSAEADILAENFSSGTMERLGLGWERLRVLNPRLIMLSISGMGRTGPYAHHHMFGQLSQGYAGLTWMVGYPGGPPRGIEDGGFWSDPVTGYAGAAAVLASLRERAVTGRGRWVDISLVEATAALFVEPLLAAQRGEEWGPRGNAHPAMAPHDVYRCAPPEGDAWVALAVRNDTEWAALCRVIGRPELAEDASLATVEGRRVRGDELRGVIEAWTRGQTAEAATTALQAAGIPAAPSRDAAALLTDPHLRARGFFAEDEDAPGGTVMRSLPPWRLHPAGVVRHGPAPVRGLDTEAVLQTAGMTSA